MNHAADFINALTSPHRRFGEVPFYWWNGSELDKNRLSEQIRMLADKGLAGVQINYAHINGGGEDNLPFGGHGKSIPGTPEQFSDEWWDFFAFAAKECEKYDMSIGMGDYTIAWIGNGYFTDTLSEMPGMHAENLSIEKKMLFSGDENTFTENVLATVYYTDSKNESPVIIYEKDKGILSPVPGICEAYIIYINEKDKSINPLHPDCGKILTDIYFNEFFRRVPDVKPGTLNYFFQDELMFGTDIKTLWSDSLREGISEKYGYDIMGFIPHLFFELGDITPKIRLDTADVRTQIMEDCYFKPVYEFHASRGLTYGCDQSSRGTEPDEFSDYFRTVRWFTAPGNDTPGRAADMIKVKVNSSIAHLYDRPRVWLEGYHSSGWGTTLESITAPTSDNFIFGANLLNLHGLYYSTNGGFFEWAPPDFHFRMPYWDDEKQWLDKYKRLSAILTTGKHKCDAAIYYPVSSCDYGVNHLSTTKKTFECAKYLFSKGLDFDFIDFQSIEKASCENGKLITPTEDYKVLIFAGVDCIRYSAIKKAKELLKNGGTVVFCGITPYASDRAGLNDEVLKNDIAEILTYPNAALTANENETLAFINSHITRSFLPEDIYSDNKVYIHTREHGKSTLCFVRYAPENSVCRFEAEGTPYLLNSETGKTIKLEGTVSADGFTFVKMPLGENEDTLILFTSDKIEYDDIIDTADSGEYFIKKEIILDGEWDFSLIPTLDNRYGDYFIPSGGMIGAQARFFDIMSVDDESNVDFELKNIAFGRNTSITKIVCNDAPESLCRYISTIPDMTRDSNIVFNGIEYNCETQDFYSRYGYICTDDYGVSLHEQGHHGLKGRLYDDNIFFAENCVYYTYVYTPCSCNAKILMGDIKPDCIFINGKKAENNDITLTQGKNYICFCYTYKEDDAVNYRNRGKIRRTSLHITKENPHKNDLPLCVDSFANSDYFRLSSSERLLKYFCFRFASVPGFYGFNINIHGKLHSVFCNEEEMAVYHKGKGVFDTEYYEVRAENKHDHITDVVFYVEAYDGYEYADIIPVPADILCTKGRITTGDLSSAGALRCYSGKSVYEKDISIEKLYPEEKFIIDIDDAAATLSIEINGKNAAVFTYKPFSADITDYIINGENHIKITVSNTLCNHYSTIPSKYSNYPKDSASGIISPVKILVKERL